VLISNFFSANYQKYPPLEHQATPEQHQFVKKIDVRQNIGLNHIRPNEFTENRIHVFFFNH